MPFERRQDAKQRALEQSRALRKFAQRQPRGGPERFQHSQGALNGARTLSWDNGATQEVAHWANGLRDGGYSRWSPDGVLLETGTFHAGAHDGTWTAFYDDGTPARRVERHALVRAHNQTIVLDTFLRGVALSRVDVADATGLSRPVSGLSEGT